MKSYAMRLIMNNEELVSSAIDYVSELLGKNSGGHDTAHSLRVYKNAMQIADKEPGCDLLVVKLAAILHDADDHKLCNNVNNENTRAFLAQKGVSEGLIEEIVRTVNSVSFSKNRGKKPETLEGKIVQDADRLDAMGAIGIARTFAYGGEHGRSIEESVQHFYDKLLLLKDELNTETAKEIASKRHVFLEAYIAELKEEIQL